MVHSTGWALLSQSPLQELFAVPIRNIRAVLHCQLFTIKPENSLQLHFEPVSTNLFCSPAVRMEKFKIACP